jgi:hypothetical protein
LRGQKPHSKKKMGELDMKMKYENCMKEINIWEKALLERERLLKKRSGLKKVE